MSWSFHNPVRVVAGSLDMLPELLRSSGELLLVTSAGFVRRGGVDRVRGLLPQRRIRLVDDVVANPDMADVERHRFEGEEIVAIGGGSVIDTAKLIAVGGLKPAAARRARFIAIPTTAGTGSEVTPFATVWDHAAKRKHSIAGDPMFPDVALLDAELTLTMPEDVTLSTGLDAITQALESTWSRRANPITTAFAVRALRSALPALPALLSKPDDLALRAQMLEASTLAGLAISHTRTALCHSISYPITAHFGVPHGFACAFTLPAVFAFNRAIDDARFEQLARGIGFHSADGLHRHLVQLLETLELRKRVALGAEVLALAPEMLAPGRADNNLREASVEDVREIVARSL